MRPVFHRAFEKFNGGPIEAVEVGVYLGLNAEEVVKSWPCIQLRLVDDFREVPSARVEARARMAPYKVLWYDAASLHVARQLLNQSLDLVYLDADHTLTGVNQDIAAWLPKLRPGGILGGDDYANTTCPGVRRAVNRFVVDNDLILHAEPNGGGGDWWIEL